MSIKFIITLAFTFSICSAHNKNAVAEFFNGSERQMEGRTQCLEIKRALGDMLRLNPIRLKAAKYRDYGGTPNQWTILELVGKYFVPVSSPMREDEFFQSYREPKARIAIKKVLRDLGDCRP